MDIASGKSTNGRHELERLLAELDHGQAGVLIVAKLDRLARSIVDFGRIMEQAKRRDWNLVALDLGVDTTTSNGRLVANVMMSVAEWERERIGERTRDAMAVKPARGDALGAPSGLPALARRRILR